DDGPAAARKIRGDVSGAAADVADGSIQRARRDERDEAIDDAPMERVVIELFPVGSRVLLGDGIVTRAHLWVHCGLRASTHAGPIGFIGIVSIRTSANPAERRFAAIRAAPSAESASVAPFARDWWTIAIHPPGRMTASHPSRASTGSRKNRWTLLAITLSNGSLSVGNASAEAT